MTPERHAKAKKVTIIAIAIAIFSVVQFMNHTGFCYDKLSYISKYELIDLALFGHDAPLMNHEQKVEAARNGLSLHYKMGSVAYPECCNISSKYFLLSNLAHFVNKTFAGRHIYQISIAFKSKDTVQGRQPFEQMLVAVNACGVHINDWTSIDVPESSYEDILERNKEFWGRRKIE